MPANVDLFSMLRPGALQQLTGQQLREELRRTFSMLQAVISYQALIVATIGSVKEKA